ncbi:MAG: repeat-containing protein [Planctomycetaceae bacterium]|nr:repeat-containing protein [Planctomycetaceae bacterium]
MSEPHVIMWSGGKDSRCVATASSDGSARIWDAASGRPLTPPPKHPSDVWFLVFNPDSRRIVTGGVDGSARIWDAKTGQLVLPPLAHEPGHTIENRFHSRWDQAASN